jgi:hypothetical protein
MIVGAVGCGIYVGSRRKQALRWYSPRTRTTSTVSDSSNTPGGLGKVRR